MLTFSAMFSDVLFNLIAVYQTWCVRLRDDLPEWMPSGLIGSRALSMIYPLCLCTLLWARAWTQMFEHLWVDPSSQLSWMHHHHNCFVTLRLFLPLWKLKDRCFQGTGGNSDCFSRNLTYLKEPPDNVFYCGKTWTAFLSSLRHQDAPCLLNWGFWRTVKRKWKRWTDCLTHLPVDSLSCKYTFFCTDCLLCYPGSCLCLVNVVNTVECDRL